MKYIKTIGLVAVGAMALMAFGAGSATATTLELTAATQNQAVELTASLKDGTGISWKKTDGSAVNLCTGAHLTGKTEEPFTTAGVGGALTELSFSKCNREGVVVDKAGSFNVEHIPSTTNGTVRSVGTEVTVPSPFGVVNCKTGTGAHIGTLTGSAAGNATLDINAAINCGFTTPSVVWEGEYTVTTPTKLGVSS